MQEQEQYEVISHPGRYQILKGNMELALVHVYVTDDNFQHVDVQMPNQQYLKSEFDLGMTIVPGLTRTIYLYNQLVASFTYVHMYLYECKTWLETEYVFECDLDTIHVYKKVDHVQVACIEKDKHNNHIHVTFGSDCFDPMKLIIALFPCLRIN